MNKVKNFDNTFCGNLPLHLTNLIQPYGALMVLEKEDFRLIQASENLATFFNVPLDSLLDRPIRDLIPAEQFEELANSLYNGSINRIPINLEISVNDVTARFLALLHPRTDHVVIEVEERKDFSGSSFINFYQQLRFIMSALNGASTVEEVCQIALSELKKFSGFHRLMIYQFDEEWNGTVIAELMDEIDLEPYLGLKFPASDIPRQAREMYKRNPYRLIPDSSYKPVKLYPVLNPLTGAFTELSDCNIRSVAGVHLEYLANMGVGASMSTRIQKDDQLWGLISCHHKEARYLDFEMCAVFELLSDIVSAKITTLLAQVEFDERAKLQAIQHQLVDQISKNGIIEGLAKNSADLLKFLDAEGAAVVMNRKIETTGNTPVVSEIRDLVLWLQSNKQDKVFHTSRLIDDYDPPSGFSRDASGIISLPLDAQRGEYIIGFRAEAVRTVNWGGNPNEAVQFEQNKNSYHPRNSFKLWQQSVENTSLPWQPYQVMLAENFRNMIIDTSYNQV